MGYRLYLGKMKSKTYEKIKFMSEDELMIKFPETAEFDGEKHFFNFLNLPFEKVYCFGKYYELPIQAEPFFIQNMDFEIDHDFKLISKDDLSKIIEDRRKYIINVYDEIIQEGPSVCEKELKLLINDFKDYMLINGQKIDTAVRAYNLNNTETVTDSHLYIFAIFELIRIYKTFDWKNDVMIFYGW